MQGSVHTFRTVQTVHDFEGARWLLFLRIDFCFKPQCYWFFMISDTRDRTKVYNTVDCDFCVQFRSNYFIESICNLEQTRYTTRRKAS